MSNLTYIVPIDFNPRLREGGDSRKASEWTEIQNFNPRLREGGDYNRQRYNESRLDFNPRLREGGDG